MRSAMRIGIISSSGGSAFFAAMECLAAAEMDIEPVVIVDRKCGIQEGCQKHGIHVLKIPFTDKKIFSQECAAFFASQDCNNTLLFYSRLISPSPFEMCNVQVCNIHPSLLPSFPGIGAVRKAHNANVGVIGATLHLVDNGVDTGPILAQVASSVRPPATLAELERISYLQKTYLMLAWVESVALGITDVLPLGVSCGVISCANIVLLNPLLRTSFVELCGHHGNL